MLAKRIPRTVKPWRFSNPDRPQQSVVLKKSFYDWSWSAWYDDIGASSKFAGPFMTRGELAECLERLGWERVKS